MKPTGPNSHIKRQQCVTPAPSNWSSFFTTFWRAIFTMPSQRWRAATSKPAARNSSTASWRCNSSRERSTWTRAGNWRHNMSRFYSMLRSQMMKAQVQQDGEILRELVQLLFSVREAWAELNSRRRRDGSSGSAGLAQQVRNPRTHPSSGPDSQLEGVGFFDIQTNSAVQGMASLEPRGRAAL